MRDDWKKKKILNKYLEESYEKRKKFVPKDIDWSTLHVCNLKFPEMHQIWYVFDEDYAPIMTVLVKKKIEQHYYRQCAKNAQELYCETNSIKNMLTRHKILWYDVIPRFELNEKAAIECADAFRTLPHIWFPRQSYNCPVRIDPTSPFVKERPLTNNWFVFNEIGHPLMCIIVENEKYSEQEIRNNFKDFDSKNFEFLNGDDLGDQDFSDALTLFKGAPFFKMTK